MIIPSNGFPGRPPAIRPEAPPAIDGISFAAILKAVTAPGDAIADRFNEDGFFTPTDGPPASASPASPIPVATPAPIAIAEDQPLTIDRSCDVDAGDRAAVRAGPPYLAAPRDVRRSATQPTLVRSSSAATSFPTTTSLPTPPDRDIGPAIRPAALRAALRLLVSTVPVAVALHDVAGGLAVVARVTGLDATDRVRLAEEIAGLLARHGLSAADIMIAAPAAARGGRGED